MAQALPTVKRLASKIANVELSSAEEHDGSDISYN